MAKTNAPLLAFNRGLVSSTALVRVDVDRMRLSAEIMTNWLPKTAGSMFLRPGTQWLGSSLKNAFAIDIPFVASTSDTALIEFSDGKMRVRVNDVLITREAVTTTVPNSNFASSAGWTDASANGGTLQFGGSGLVLDAENIGGLAVCRREITVAVWDVGKRHALNIEVSRGPVTFRCGSTAGADDYIDETTLRTGSHSLGITPTGNFFIQFQSDADVDRIVASCVVAPAGVMALPMPYSADDLPLVRWDQSADVLFLACKGKQQRRIERRSTDSWSIVLYQPDNGPFRAARSANVKLKVDSTFGNTLLKSDLPFFDATHVGAMFRMFNGNTRQTYRLGANDTFTDPIRVTGVRTAQYNDRDFVYSVSGTWTGTLNWERSFDDPDSGFKTFRKQYGSGAVGITANVANITNGEDEDNAIAYYRLGFADGTYGSGTAVVDISYDGFGGYGICRVLAVNSATEAVVEVVERFNNTTLTDIWEESVWSPKRGYPDAVAFHKGRLWWAGKTRFIGSIADNFESFDPEFEGDAGPINRTLGAGPIDQINFMLSLGRLIIGTPGTEFSIKSSSLDEPLTPQNTQAGDPSTQGSMEGANAVKVDSQGIFAQRAGRSVFELVYSADSYEYVPRDLTLLVPDLTGSAKVVGLAVQRRPDTRIHCWLSDGTVAILTYEPSEEVVCWSRLETEGNVEGCTVLPGEEEDQVYYRVRRTVNGVTVRYLEKWAKEADCIGGLINRQADCFIVRPNIIGSIVDGLAHLEGEAVIAWAEGRDRGTYYVAGASITLDTPVDQADVLVGLPYFAYYRSTKLAYAAAAGTALAQVKKVNLLALILGRVHNDGIEFGGDFINMDRLPRLYQGRTVDPVEVFAHYEEPAIAFPGAWDTDARLCLRATAPRPCVVEAAIVSVETNDKL